ncbi:tyrosine-type recombinase/integrase [Lonsdalea quercina]|uniref:tyrosine-type recombinase/integrase n=1 Tax=Lonsdalea quercina TaxID=71657 RepID=UPI0039759D56
MNKLKEELELSKDNNKINEKIAEQISYLSNYLKRDVTSLLEKVHFDLQEGMIETLSFYAENYSFPYTQSLFQSLLYIFKIFTPKEINKEFAWDLKVNLNIKNYRYTVNTKIFMIKWYDLGLSGVNDEAYTFFNEMKLKGKPPGQVVGSMDPERGPFTDNEIKQISLISRKAPKKKTLDIECYLIIQLLMTTGRRISQILNLRMQDVFKQGGLKILSIQRAKQRPGSREFYRTVKVSKKLCNQLNRHARDNIAFLNSHGFNDIPLCELRKAPLFLNKKLLMNSSLGGSFNQLIIGQSNFIYKLSKFASVHNVISERTNEIIKMNPNRFRYTLATNMARNGASVQEIAAALDHSSTACAAIYIKNEPGNVEVIDKAVTPFLNDIAEVFMGVRPYSGDVLMNALKPDSLKTIKSENASDPCHGCKRFNPWRVQ